ncbi:Hint domain-containing protein [Palleronia sediminis]|uniref:Hint domain-containing protein n=1 Tax=Palleronia sediminis TaxID=2547833 RepID=UPI0023EA5AE3|nr:Hint domain-containing protein [Palleronia sediminis]
MTWRFTEWFETKLAEGKLTSDDVVSGTNGADRIDAGYRGDPEGDRIDAGDFMHSDRDIVDARGGDDTVSAGHDDDIVLGGAGDDLLSGDNGNDVIYGDRALPGVATEGTFRWSALDDPNGHGDIDDGDDLSNRVVSQTVDGVEVRVAIPGSGVRSSFEDDDIFTGDTGVDDESSLKSLLDAHESGTYEFGFSEAVENVRFTLSDLDANLKGVQVIAVGPDGKQVPVEFELGKNLQVSADGTISESKQVADDDPDSKYVGAEISIAGPVQGIRIIHSAGSDSGRSGIHISDVKFTTTVAEGEGDDTLIGGHGDDTLYGEGGDDSLSGGAGDDELYGDNPPEGSRERFEWDRLDETGKVQVTFTKDENDKDIETFVSNTKIDTRGIDSDGEPVDDDSSLKSDLNGHGNEATYVLDYSEEVTDGSFRITDIDGDGIVRVRAYDDEGRPVEVTLTDAGTKITLKDEDSVAGSETADSKGGYASETSKDYSVLVNIAGPFSRIEITHEQDGHANSGIHISDVYYTEATTGPGGDDTLHGGDGDDLLVGAGGRDVLEGGHGADTIKGGDDADLIVGGTDGDRIDGGSGGRVVTRPSEIQPGESADYDILDLTGQGAFTVEDLVVDGNGNGANGTVVFRDASGHETGRLTFTEIEELRGDSPVPPPLGGKELNGIVEGDDEANLIDENYTGDPEGDLIDRPDQIVNGSPIGTNADIVKAGGGDDTVFGRLGGDTIFGEDGNDSVVGGSGADLIDGGEGDDALFGDGGRDTILGQAGDDTLSGQAGDDSLSGGAGDDSLHGGTGDDTLLGGDGSDTALGGEGDDHIDTSGTDQAFDTDVPFISPDPEGAESPDVLGDLDPNPDDDRDFVDGGAGNDTIFTGDDADTILGGAGNDRIEAGIDDDSVDGGDGDDYITDIQGSDTILGGDGNDTIIAGIDTLPDAKDPNPDDGRDLVDGGKGNDLIYTGDDADTIFGGEGNDTIHAGIDDDSIEGGAGDDSIHAGAGNDTVWAGKGDDWVDGGEGDDFISGGDGNDTLLGGDGNDTLIANGDSDLLEGGAGNDFMRGNIGDDTMYGGDGDDTAVGGLGDDYIDGGAGNDSINAAGGNDTVDGGAGNDTINGGDEPGDDLLRGGDDADTFELLLGNDTVLGGSGGNDFDTLDLRGSVAPGGSYKLVNVRPDNDNTDGTSPNGVIPGEVVYSNGIDGEVLFFDADGNQNGKLVFENIERIIPCFTPGTLIATPRGERPVEDLREGDRIITRDSGIQEVRWIGEKRLARQDLAAQPDLRPVLISKGALGFGLPERDMLVSPNHRMLVNNDKSALYFEDREVLVAAKHLCHMHGIAQVCALGVSYIHFMFDQHEVVLADGAWSESFQPGDYTLKGIGEDQRAEILRLFPEFEDYEGIEAYRAARRTLKKHEAKLL